MAAHGCMSALEALHVSVYKSFQPRTSKRLQPRFAWFLYRVEPVGVHCLLGVGALWYKHCPFASMLTAWVLPLWFYTFLEQVEVCSR